MKSALEGSFQKSREESHWVSTNSLLQRLRETNSWKKGHVHQTPFSKVWQTSKCFKLCEASEFPLGHVSLELSNLLQPPGKTKDVNHKTKTIPWPFVQSKSNGLINSRDLADLQIWAMKKASFLRIHQKSVHNNSHAGRTIHSHVRGHLPGALTRESMSFVWYLSSQVEQSGQPDPNDFHRAGRPEEFYREGIFEGSLTHWHRRPMLYPRIPRCLPACVLSCTARPKHLQQRENISSGNNKKIVGVWPETMNLGWTLTGTEELKGGKKI